MSTDNPLKAHALTARKAEQRVADAVAGWLYATTLRDLFGEDFARGLSPAQVQRLEDGRGKVLTRLWTVSGREKGQDAGGGAGSTDDGTAG